MPRNFMRGGGGRGRGGSGRGGSGWGNAPAEGNVSDGWGVPPELSASGWDTSSWSRPADGDASGDGPDTFKGRTQDNGWAKRASGSGAWGNGSDTRGNERDTSKVKAPVRGWGNVLSDEGGWGTLDTSVPDGGGQQAGGSTPNQRTEGPPVSSPKQTRRYSVSASIQDRDVPMDDWSHVTHANEVQSSSRAPSPAPTDITASSSRLLLQMPTRTLTDRRKLWAELIKHTTRAVRIQTELRQLERDRDSWKATQTSSCYSHAGSSVRQVLDDVRLEYEKKIADCKKHLTTVINTVADFPDMAQILAINFNPEADEAEARQYISNLKEWMDNIAPVNTAAQPEAPKDPSTRDSSIEEGQIGSSGPKKRQRSDSRPHDRDTLFSLVQGMEDRMSELMHKVDETLVFRQHNTVTDTLCEKVHIPEQYMQLSAKVSQVNGDMEELMKSTAPVLSEANSRNEVLEQLKAEHEHLKRENALIREQHSGLERSLQENAASIRQTSELVERLLKPTAPPTPQPPLDLSEDLIKSIITRVGQFVQQEVRPLLSDTTEKCLSHVQKENALMYTQVWRKLENAIHAIDMYHGLARSGR